MLRAQHGSVLQKQLVDHPEEVLVYLSFKYQTHKIFKYLGRIVFCCFSLKNTIVEQFKNDMYGPLG